MLRILGKRAQTTAEYAILIALVVGAVVAMQVYVKRGIQGRIRDVVDNTGNTAGEEGGENILSGSQYEPYYLTSTADTNQTSNATETIQAGGGVVRDTSSDVVVNRENVVGAIEEDAD